MPLMVKRASGGDSAVGGRVRDGYGDDPFPPELLFHTIPLTALWLTKLGLDG